jgi:Asp-tRNA(Asn)/Glu-tRNA(Gln) amidotransferase A subunit family amidase
VLDTAKLLSEMGHELVEAAPPSFDGGFLAQSAIIFAGNFAAREADLPDPATFDPWNRMLLEMGRGVSAGDYVRGMGDLQQRSREVVAFFDDYDLLLTPTVGKPPPLVGALRTSTSRSSRGLHAHAVHEHVEHDGPARVVGAMRLRRARLPSVCSSSAGRGRSDRDPGERSSAARPWRICARSSTHLRPEL